MARLRILHAPGYAPKVNTASVRRMIATLADSVGTSEAMRVAHVLDPIALGYTAVCGDSPTDTRKVLSLRGDAGDNPMLVRDDHLLLEVRITKLTDPGRPRKVTPERWGYLARYEWVDGKTVTHINLHTSLRGLHPWRWKREMAWARAQILAAQRDGDYVVVTGDLNTRRATQFLKDLGLKVWRNGIDYLAFDARLFRGKSRTWTPPNTDHPWMLADLFDNQEEAAR